MKLPQIAVFVKNWNKTILDAPVSDEQIDIETETLMNKIRESGGLRSISSTPLLCAMLCTINYHSNGFVPTNGDQLLGLINQSEAARTVKFFQFESDSLGFISYSNLKNFSSVEELKLVLRNRELDYDLFSVSKLTNLKTISLILNEEVCWDIEGKLFDAEENNDSITWMSFVSILKDIWREGAH